ncbi:MAG TPA: filamentous hemagglutinin N-terminal domain-containing protein [Pseudoxanthomonas sp.]|nr:filamentous hemagglutinin N-terminal domain-containing protein [Pseudoxanthomonas sp.]
MQTGPDPLPPPADASRPARACMLATLLALLPAAAWAQERAALPEGGQVVAGEAAIDRQDRTLTVTQHSRRAILEWRSFDIGADAAVRFVQPSSAAVALNRVLGGNPSRIAGLLAANGHVYLVNAAGVLFAPGARIDVGQLVTSTLDIANGDFLAGQDRFGAAEDGWLASAPARGHPPLLPLLVAGTAAATDVHMVREEPDEAAAGGLLTLDAGADGHLRIGLEPAEVQAMIEDGGLQEDGHGLVLSQDGSTALASSAVAAGDAPQARGVALRDGRVLLLAAAGGVPGGPADADAGVAPAMIDEPAR